ncbi:MAG TPA: hypothetical protein VGB55_13335 [Tepidisphaeraceae bacterium]
MGKLTIDLPDYVIAAAMKQSNGKLDEFIQEAVESAIDYGAPESLTYHSHEELIRMLEEGLDSGPGQLLTDAEIGRWKAIARGEAEVEDK